MSALTSAAEAAIAAADAHIAVLGLVLDAAAERPVEAAKAARAALLERRKVCPSAVFIPICPFLDSAYAPWTHT